MEQATPTRSAAGVGVVRAGGTVRGACLTSALARPHSTHGHSDSSRTGGHTVARVRPVGGRACETARSRGAGGAFGIADLADSIQVVGARRARGYTGGSVLEQATPTRSAAGGGVVRAGGARGVAGCTGLSALVGPSGALRDAGSAVGDGAWVARITSRDTLGACGTGGVTSSTAAANSAGGATQSQCAGRTGGLTLGIQQIGVGHTGSAGGGGARAAETGSHTCLTAASHEALARHTVGHTLAFNKLVVGGT